MGQQQLASQVRREFETGTTHNNQRPLQLPVLHLGGDTAQGLGTRNCDISK